MKNIQLLNGRDRWRHVTPKWGCLDGWRYTLPVRTGRSDGRPARSNG